ncbi:histidine phosphatase family protein [Rhodovibrionaceae bacterium A322]
MLDTTLQLPSHRGPIYLLRHGETFWNRERRMQGRLNADLTPLGEAQASAMGRCLKDLLAREPEAPRFLVSPLGRTRQTAELVAETSGLSMALAEFEPRIQEISFGRWEGMTYDEIDAASPQLWAQVRENRWHLASPDGESYRSSAERVLEWFVDIAEETRPLVVVSHGGIGRILRGLYTGVVPEKIADLEVPQDALFCLRAGQLERYETDIHEQV